MAPEPDVLKKRAKCLDDAFRLADASVKRSKDFMIAKNRDFSRKHESQFYFVKTGGKNVTILVDFEVRRVREGYVGCGRRD